MDIFISWSGERSKLIATYLNNWIKQVLQSTNPWVSTGMKKGISWDSEIMEKLSNSRIGIICLTRENLESNWIHFEAGAIAKGIGKVFTICLDIEPSQVKFPLGRFQAASFYEDDIYKMISDINLECDSQLDIENLKEVFQTNWQKLKLRSDEIREMEVDNENLIRDSNDMLSELIENSRNLDLSLKMNIHWIMDRIVALQNNNMEHIRSNFKPDWSSNNNPYRNPLRFDTLTSYIHTSIIEEE